MGWAGLGGLYYNLGNVECRKHDLAIMTEVI